MVPTVTSVAQSAGPVAIWIAAISLMGIFIRQIGPWKRQANETEARLREAMALRIDKLEARLERQEAHHKVEQTIGNHKYRNIVACFDAMLLMLEMNPDRGPEIVQKIKAMRANQMLAEAEEAAILRGALIRAESDAPASATTTAAEHAVDAAHETLAESRAADNA